MIKVKKLASILHNNWWTSIYTNKPTAYWPDYIPYDSLHLDDQIKWDRYAKKVLNLIKEIK